MNIRGKKILVTGGTGGLGEGIVRSLMRQGAHLLVPTRQPEKLDSLREYVADINTGNLEGVTGSLSTPDEAQKLATVVSKKMTPDVIVASIGGWSQEGNITEISFDSWEKVVRDNLTTHFLAMRHLSPLLRQNGTYIHVNGTSAEIAWPGAGPVAAMAAAQKSLSQTLAKENEGRFRVRELILPPVNTRARQGRGRPEWPTAEEVGDFIAGLIHGDDGQIIHRFADFQKTQEK